MPMIHLHLHKSHVLSICKTHLEGDTLTIYRRTARARPSLTPYMLGSLRKKFRIIVVFERRYAAGGPDLIPICGPFWYTGRLRKVLFAHGSRNTLGSPHGLVASTFAYVSTRHVWRRRPESAIGSFRSNISPWHRFGKSVQKQSEVAITRKLRLLRVMPSGSRYFVRANGIGQCI